MTRTQTVVLALLVMHFLLGGLCLLVARGERTTPALRWWGWGLLTYACGLLLTQQRWLPAAHALTWGNALIAWAPILSIEAVMAHTGRHLDRRIAYAALALAAALLGWNNFGPAPIMLLNVLIPTPLAVLLFMYGARWLLRSPPPKAETAAVFMATIMLVAVVVWLFRAAFVWLAPSITRDKDTIDLIIALIAIVQIIVAVGCTLALFWIEVRKMQVTLTEVAHTDVLTGLPNRRAVIERFAETESQAVRHGTRFGVLLLDIDNFKTFNDRYGHQTGDAALRHVADVLARSRRAGDMLGRVGGEEFVMLLAGDEAITAGAAERLRQQVEEAAFDCRGALVSITVSGGLATFPTDGVDWDTLFAEADKRLYFAKRDGRNRVVSS